MSEPWIYRDADWEHGMLCESCEQPFVDGDEIHHNNFVAMLESGVPIMGEACCPRCFEGSGARVAEGSGLLSRPASNRRVGSNPTPTAWTRFREAYRTQRTPLWIGLGQGGVAVWIRLRDGGIHFGVKLTRDHITFNNARERQRGIALWWRRNRKGQRGTPHALVVKAFVS